MSEKIEALLNNDVFADRHIGSSAAQKQQMLDYLGVDDMESLLKQVVPSNIRRQSEMAIDEGLSELAALKKLRNLARENKRLKSFIGQGYYNTITPPVIQRNILENPAWYTAYTPYQAEISQGRMEAMINFQTMVADLTGLPLANASMLDEATACAEAMSFCKRVSKSKSNTFFVANDCHPRNIELVQTRAKPLNIEIVVGDPLNDLESLDVFGVLLQYPNTYGGYSDYSDIIETAHNNKALVAVSADLLALTLLKPPGEMGADIAIGNTQRFGVPLGYGGPHAAYMSTRDEHKRALPGRIIGLSIDSNGNPAYRLALQTREQHIRREKATSNICTAQALLAIMAGMYAVYNGADGLTKVAQRVFRYTAVFADGIKQLGLEVTNETFFDTVAISLDDSSEIIKRAEAAGYNINLVSATMVSVAFDELSTPEDIEALWGVFNEKSDLSAQSVFEKNTSQISEALVRTSRFLTNEVFSSHHSETQMMRYLRHLADKDLALDRTMIPLGSCTMKLNAAAELIPISWPEFSQIHPYVPLDQVPGYHKMIGELERMLCEVTGYDAISLQPNSGAQGEYAGLLAISAYHHSRGDDQRNICLIPASAHGTNPASAQMAGMKVVVVKTAENGNIDLGDLASKCEKHQENLAAIMITYPSTHGIFEEDVMEVCEMIHQAGGQVYIDGANMNAMVGVAAPGEFGGDVSHLNLHKTFAIPHGGGGPGVGPIGVKQHLAEFLPTTPVKETTTGSVSGAPWGSASILPISWMYISMLGKEGLYHATTNAILNANYMATRLAEYYPLLYTGKNGRVAHECIVDLRPIKDKVGISVDDVAKRLIDYGFHAPTMSFPVPGTLMIEPTESESLEELDRFCDAMIRIREEIKRIEVGEWPVDDNPLINAPHTIELVTSSTWSCSYSREDAAYPVKSLYKGKYWPPVARVDNVYGDKNLICSCPSIDSYT
ncbi:MAG: aminomethyl-transferring glycine dehydrogenase [Gammaproteobacteria bacterium]